MDYDAFAGEEQFGMAAMGDPELANGVGTPRFSLFADCGLVAHLGGVDADDGEQISVGEFGEIHLFGRANAFVVPEQQGIGPGFALVIGEPDGGFEESAPVVADDRVGLPGDDGAGDGDATVAEKAQAFGERAPFREIEEGGGLAPGF